MSIEGFDYECALTGITAQGTQYHEADGLDDLPPGWIQISFQRRAPNPQYILLQQVKNSMIEGMAAQVPDDYPADIVEAHIRAIGMQVEAQFIGLESKTPPYITYEEEIYVAPPESNEVVREAVNEVRENLGLELFPGPEEAEEEPASLEEAVEEVPEIEELEPPTDNVGQEAVNS